MSNEKNESFRYVRKMAKTIENDEKRFVFLRSQVNSVEDCMKEGPKKCQTIKSLVIWALKEFIPIENYKSDPRMLDFWYLMGKYSVNMGMEAVLERIHRLGYFKNVPEFYLMWADYFGSKQNRESFDKIVQICEENCQLGPSEERFKFLLQKHFESDYFNEGKTLDVIKMLADKSEVVKSDLTLFQRNKVVDTPQNIISAIHEEFSVYKDVTYTKSSITVQNTVKNKRISYYPELDDITLAGAHGKFSTDMFTSTPRRSVMPSDFVPLDLTEGTQFFDPTEKEEKGEGGGGLFGCQLTDKAGIKENEKDCGGLKMKKRLSFADENKRGVSKNMNPMAEAVENRGTSYYPELDDITLAGAHGKFSTDMFTSTPRRSVMPSDFIPLDLTEGDQFFDPTEKEEKGEGGGLFGCQLKGNEKGGGLNIKKRLSFADENQRGISKNANPMAEAVERVKKSKTNPNELIKTLPQLKISSPISEGSENFMSFNTPEFPSPFRKKKKDQE
uniref:Uncharacterized protein n=1 Tax=Meloidogyne enterolobii TaxID=390850 RepID=A0A6V7V4F0_MELEN|nr:unnamed protein product [Meloidogyne enterolobii]